MIWPMPVPENSWQAKVERLLGGGRGAPVRLARLLGIPERSARNWLSGRSRPRAEDDVVRRIAEALNVAEWWLSDQGIGGDAPPNNPDLNGLMQMIPAKYRPLALVFRDPAAGDWLLEQLRLYERARQQGRRLP